MDQATDKGEKTLETRHPLTWYCIASFLVPKCVGGEALEALGGGNLAAKTSKTVR